LIAACTDATLQPMNSHRVSTAQLADRLWKFHHVYDAFLTVDLTVCLGSYDLRVAGRCASLLKSDTSHLAVVTGGYGNWTRGVFKKPEADIFAEIIVQSGIAADRLLLDRDAQNIGENIRNARTLAPPNVSRVLFVTKPQTQRRVLATAQKVWPNIEVLVTAPNISFEEQAEGAGGPDNLINEMVGDVERLHTYPGQGFQNEIAIPADIMDAYRSLRDRGFDKHCAR
jgi:uncharacterized SAM-binding protein YcdF (DUF218 family)